MPCSQNSSMAMDIVVGRSEGDLQKFGLKGCVYLGKQFIKMGQQTSLSNNVYLDIARAHAMFICGKRGGGKCLHGDTLITLEDGAVIPIHQLENDSRSIFSLNQDLKMERAEKSHFYKRNVNRLLELTLRSGKVIKLTPEHPLLTVKGWVPAEKLSISSRIATPRKLEAFGDEYLSEEKTKLLAYLLAEGHLSNGFILFTNTDPKITEDFTISILALDSSLLLKNHSKSTARIVQHNRRKVSGRNEKGQFTQETKFEAKSTLRKWLDDLGIYGKLSHEKFIPDVIFRAPKNKVSLFLNRLFSCDGSIYNEEECYWKISYSSSSEQLARQVQHLLSRFGIIAFLRKKKTARRDCFELIIRGEHVSTFLTEIGFYGVKEQRCEKALKECPRIIRNSNVDTIPKEIWDSFKPENWAELGRKLGYAYPKSARETIHYSTSRQKLLQIAMAEESELLEALATSDIFWDEIRSINTLEGEFTVYDITVPANHNFVANDIIVHNSYTMGVIAEGLADMPPDVSENLSIIMLDTMGVYWTMRYPNKKEEEQLVDWGFKPKGLDIKIFTPKDYFYKYKEKGMPTDVPFSIRPSDMDIMDWAMTFEIDRHGSIGVLLESILFDLREAGKEDYDIDDLIALVRKNQKADQSTKNALENLLISTKAWGVFDKNGTKLKELAVGGQVTILDVSCYATMPGGWKIKALIVALVSQKLFVERMLARKDEEFASVHHVTHFFGEEGASTKQQMPLVWLVIDEAHEFLPREPVVEVSSAPLITILREGRQPGISLILATQQPGKIHTDVMTQSDIVLSHRITAKLDTDALGMLMQSYMREGMVQILDNLPRAKGSAILFDDTNERMYPIKIRPRFTWHGGESPNALKSQKQGEEKSIFK